MAGAQNAIIGSDSFGTDLPQTQLEEENLVIEKNMAKFSKSKEFEKLKEHLEQRITYYQNFLPGGVPPENVPDEERGKYWAVSNMVIGELRAIIDAYEQAAQVVQNATPR